MYLRQFVGLKYSKLGGIGSVRYSFRWEEPTHDDVVFHFVIVKCNFPETRIMSIVLKRFLYKLCNRWVIHVKHSVPPRCPTWTNGLVPFSTAIPTFLRVRKAVDFIYLVISPAKSGEDNFRGTLSDRHRIRWWKKMAVAGIEPTIFGSSWQHSNEQRRCVGVLK